MRIKLNNPKLIWKYKTFTFGAHCFSTIRQLDFFIVAQFEFKKNDGNKKNVSKIVQIYTKWKVLLMDTQKHNHISYTILQTLMLKDEIKCSTMTAISAMKGAERGSISNAQFPHYYLFSVCCWRRFLREKSIGVLRNIAMLYQNYQKL